MNTLNTPAERRQAMGRMYTRIEDEHSTRSISFDEEGVIAFAGSQGTNHVYFAERQEVDEDEETMQFRVLRLEPNYKKGMHPNSRTGVPEFGKRLTVCRYVVADVVVPRLNQRVNLGRALQAVQEEFRHAMRSPIDRGQVHSDGEVMRVYNRWFESR